LPCHTEWAAADFGGRPHLVTSHRKHRNSLGGNKLRLGPADASCFEGARNAENTRKIIAIHDFACKKTGEYQHLFLENNSHLTAVLRVR
jgi:hypothetical protein